MFLDNNRIVSPNEWQAAREKLHAKEKELLRENDATFRTYTISGNHLEAICNHWTLLELTPRGAKDDWRTRAAS